MPNSETLPDKQKRCGWAQGSDDYIAYHDQEWGFPVADDRRLFEKLTLESFQSGLSWRTILSKRDNFRAAFDHFDFDKIAAYGSGDVDRLLSDAGIVRHRGKIEATINNAKRAQEMVADYGSLAAYFWQHEMKNQDQRLPQSETAPKEAVILSKDLKKRGWKFVGPTTVFSFMQAMGLVNDHTADCVIRDKVHQARQAFVRP